VLRDQLRQGLSQVPERTFNDNLKRLIQRAVVAEEGRTIRLKMPPSIGATA
jgi:hypothetical protein